MKTAKVPFSKIKRGGFFRIKGKILYQKSHSGYGGQSVTGESVGSFVLFTDDDPPVTPINARIVEEN